MLQHEDYLHAATILWGEAGRFAVTECQRINDEVYDGDLPPLPIVIGMTPYGRCLGKTLQHGAATGATPRITLAPVIFRDGANVVRDVLVHEMLHARLMLDGRSPDHNDPPWCEWITKLSPQVLNRPILAAPVKPRRLDGAVTRRPLDGHINRDELSRWPGSLRPADFDRGPLIAVDTA